MIRGEVVLAAGLGVLGGICMLLSSRLPYMGEFAPGSGFMPFWLGLALTALSVLFIARRVRAGEWLDGARYLPPAEWRRPVLIALGLIVCVAVIENAGWTLSVTVYIAYLMRVVEGKRWRLALGLALGTSVALWLLFRTWLGVPLPKGPWGF